MFQRTPAYYDSAEWTQGVATNYDASAQTLFIKCPIAEHITIRCDQTITIKLNSTSNNSITVNPNTDFNMDIFVHHLYITTTVSTAIKVVLTQPE